jgi:hypothetical protein
MRGQTKPGARDGMMVDVGADQGQPVHPAGGSGRSRQSTIRSAPWRAVEVISIGFAIVPIVLHSAAESTTELWLKSTTRTAWNARKPDRIAAFGCGRNDRYVKRGKIQRA